MKTVFCPSVISSESILHSPAAKHFPVSPLLVPQPTISGHQFSLPQTAREFRAACANSVLARGQPGDGTKGEEGGVCGRVRAGAVGSAEEKGEVGKSLEEPRNCMNSAFVEFSKDLSPP